jgi:DNA-binding transcriptional ArsR family regulator
MYEDNEREEELRKLRNEIEGLKESLKSLSNNLTGLGERLPEEPPDELAESPEEPEAVSEETEKEPEEDYTVEVKRSPERSRRWEEREEKPYRRYYDREQRDYFDDFGDRLGDYIESFVESVMEGVTSELESSIFIHPRMKKRKSKSKRYGKVDAKKAADVMSALGNEYRVRILDALDSGGLYASDLQDKLEEISPSTLSSHLDILEAAGLIKQEKRRGRYLITISGRLAVRMAFQISNRSKNSFVDE